MDHTDTEVQINGQGACGTRDHVDDHDIARRDIERNLWHLEMYERELEEYERQIRDREQYMTAMDVEMHTRGDRLELGQRPDRGRRRHNSSEC